MGLDQYAYYRVGDTKHEFAYWRKCYDLHEFMRDVWIRRRELREEIDKDLTIEQLKESKFNGIEMRIDYRLLEDIRIWLSAGDDWYGFGNRVDGRHIYEIGKFVGFAQRLLDEGTTPYYAGDY